MGQMQASLVNPTGELPEPQNVLQGNETLNKRDGFELTEIDQQIEAAERIGDLCKFPSDEEIVAAARGL